MRRIRPIVIKEFRQIFRDKSTLGILFFFPAFMLIMYGFALNFDVKHVSLAVADQSKTKESRALVEKFRHTEYFDYLYDLPAAGDGDILLERGDAHVVLVIPPDYSRRLGAGRDAPLQVLVDGSNASEAGTAALYVNSILLSHSSRLFMEAVRRASGMTAAMPVDLRARIWYNPELKSMKFLVPGLIGFILMITTVVSTSLSIVREKEQGSMEQIIVSPIRPAEMILGKTLPYLIISLGSAAITLVTAWGLFDVSVRGSVPLLFAMTFLYLVGGLGIGILISTAAKTQQVAFFMAVMVTMLPSMLLSGFIFPIKNMPIPIQAVTYILPMRYYLVILRGIILKGAGLEAFWGQAAALLAFSAILITISSTRMARQRL